MTGVREVLAAPLRWHFDTVSVPRVARIAPVLAELCGPARTLLDVGSGDGSLATEVARRLGGCSVRGVDVKVQPNAPFPVVRYDGRNIPHEAGTFDAVLISDVLHHAPHPGDVLREALRVLTPGGAVVVKDHFRFGPVSQATLMLMDLVGNYAQGIEVIGNYLSPTEWVELVRASGGAIDKLRWPVEVHSLPFRLVARSEYQFVARVVRAREGGV